MSQDQRAADHEIADAAVLVIVDIGSANSDRQNPDQRGRRRRENPVVALTQVLRVADTGLDGGGSFS